MQCHVNIAVLFLVQKAACILTAEMLEEKRDQLIWDQFFKWGTKASVRFVVSSGTQP